MSFPFPSTGTKGVFLPAGKKNTDLLGLNVQDLVLAGYRGHFCEKLPEARMIEAMPAGSKAEPISGSSSTSGIIA